jgi:hypothetical protein
MESVTSCYSVYTHTEFRFMRLRKEYELRSRHISNQSQVQSNCNTDRHVFSLILETMPKYEGEFIIAFRE